jgi:hypothetical protein
VIVLPAYASETGVVLTNGVRMELYHLETLIRVSHASEHRVDGLFGFEGTNMKACLRAGVGMQISWCQHLALSSVKAERPATKSEEQR